MKKYVTDLELSLFQAHILMQIHLIEIVIPN